MATWPECERLLDTQSCAVKRELEELQSKLDVR
jgi:hypothetical protein